MNSDVFGKYSAYYNLLYSDKDYAAEAAYVHDLIRQWHPGAITVLDLGCGTGNHDYELAKLGYEVTGVDLSKEMLNAAVARLNSVPAVLPLPTFEQEDIRTVRLGKTFDVVISLFHVMSYQTSNDDLRAAFATAKNHLAPGGCFLFDCWYGPGVLRDPPVVRVKRMEDGWIEFVRIAEPVMHPNENVVDVNYQVIIMDKVTHGVERLSETHRMRYLFVPEVELLLQEVGLHIRACHEWMSENSPDFTSWTSCFVVNR